MAKGCHHTQNMGSDRRTGRDWRVWEEDPRGGNGALLTLSYSTPDFHGLVFGMVFTLHLSFTLTTLCSLFLLLIYPLHQINILGDTLYNQTMKFELPKTSNIKHLGSRLSVHLPMSPNFTA